MEHPASELLGSEEAEWAFEDEWETKKVEVDESVLSKKARRSCTFFTKVRITYGGATHVFARGAGGAGGTLMPRLFSIDDDGDGDGPRGRRWLVRVVDLWLDEDEGSAYMAFSYLARAQTLVSRLDDPREYVEERAVYSSALDFVRGPPSLVTWEPPAGGGAGVFRRFEYVEGPKGPVLSKHGEAPRALTADPARAGAKKAMREPPPADTAAAAPAAASAAAEPPAAATTAAPTALSPAGGGDDAARALLRRALTAGGAGAGGTGAARLAREIADEIVAQCAPAERAARTRRVAFALQRNAALRARVASRALTAARLVALGPEEMAPDSVKRRRAADREVAFERCRIVGSGGARFFVRGAPTNPEARSSGDDGDDGDVEVVGEAPLSAVLRERCARAGAIDVDDDDDDADDTSAARAEKLVIDHFDGSWESPILATSKHPFANDDDDEVVEVAAPRRRVRARYVEESDEELDGDAEEAREPPAAEAARAAPRAPSDMSTNSEAAAKPGDEPGCQEASRRAVDAPAKRPRDATDEAPNAAHISLPAQVHPAADVHVQKRQQIVEL